MKPTTTYKKGLLEKTEVKRIIGTVLNQTHNQSETIMSDYDEDKDGCLTIDELLRLIITISTH